MNLIRRAIAAIVDYFGIGQTDEVIMGTYSSYAEAEAHNYQ